ncbi:putative FR47-like protein [Lyophyllum shimeji]|uniref:FR47-like protein n=1 Tax=Lyophyllum shimeji TaxID=47721 RepID=A0A9P3UJF1_LYOSH|nr:putative FR47-like protein [Lyophyllum shimeji]
MDGRSDLASRSLKDSVRVRYFRATDSDEVRKLYLFAMSDGPDSPRRNVLDVLLFKPGAHVTYAVILAGVSLAVLSRCPSYRAFGVMVSVFAAASLLGYRYFLSRSFIDYYDKCLTEDLADVASYYHMRAAQDGAGNLVPAGPSAFWVVECDLPEKRGTEVIGCVALDCQYEGGVLRGELRRMVVSPFYRRRGIAALLIKTLLAHGSKHGVPAIILTTTHFQEDAINMYEKLGWVETSRNAVYDYRIIKVVLIHFRLELNCVSTT